MNRKIQVAHFIPSFETGGAETFLTRLLTESKESKYTHHIVIVFKKINSKIEKKLEKNNIKLISLGLSKDIYILSKISLIKKIIKENEIDLVNTWLYKTDFYVGIICFLIGFKNIIWNVRCTDTSNHTNLIQKILVITLGHLSKIIPKKIIFNSYQSIKDHTKKGYDINKFCLIHNGFEIENNKVFNKLHFKKKYKIPSGYRIVGNISRFHPMKDHLTFLNTAYEILKKDKKYIFFLVGDDLDSKNEYLLNIINKLNIKKNIRLIGFKKNVGEYYYNFDLFCLTSSDSEGFPNVLGECMLKKTPCVSTNVGDVKYILPKNHISKPKNYKDLSNKILEIFKNINYYNKIARLGKEKIIKEFNIKKIFNLFEDEYFYSVLKKSKKEFNKLAFNPMSKNLQAPGDRRRFSNYFNKSKNNKIVINNFEEYRNVFLCQSADITMWKNSKFSNICYDLTDSYLHIPKTEIKGWLRGLAKFVTRQHKKLELNYWRSVQSMCKRSNLVICSTDDQRRKILRYNKNVQVILDKKDDHITSLKKNYDLNSKYFEIVWEGLPQNAKLIKYVKKALINLKKNHNIRLNIITDKKYYLILNKFFLRDTKKEILDIFKDTNVKIRFLEWKYKDYYKKIINCDLALIPVNLRDRFLSGKPQNKLLLFWRLGIPTITSGTVEYKKIMKNVGLEDYAVTNDEWFKKLDNLIRHKNYRERNAKEGLKYVNKKINNHVLNNKWNLIMSKFIKN